MALEWKDESSWGRGDVDRTPKTWSAQVGSWRLVVTRRHQLEGWFVRFGDLFNYRLEHQDIEGAKREASLLVRDTLMEALNVIEN
jgi:hypothetical protein